MNRVLLFLLLVFFTSCQDTPFVQGKRLYKAYCSNCHMNDGSGLSLLIPAISSSKITYGASFICLMYHGKSDTIFEKSTYLVKEMPSFKHLSSTEITNIINYINHTWHHPFKEKTIKNTTEELSDCLD
ncbi:MAG: cytochrome c [Saprospiraceae bacterium]